MDCPACGRALEEIAAGPIRVDACRPGCGGLWLDWRELSRVERPGSPGRDALLSVPVAAAAPPPTGPRRCPRCPRAVLARRFYSVRRQVVLDECPTCGGVFLEAGALARLQDELGEPKGGRAPGPWEPPRVDDAFGPLGIVGREVAAALAEAVRQGVLSSWRWP
jgi:Zn-finger nucleic acid-binding protein